ncbi:ATP-binding protein [Clostridium beijerinckii]|uniref:histidine kinase n=1 Tax=Clostridium beijerinckii TaxID=1520 RepID=A0AAX0B8Z1_CLOBE|nr:ATP-binding protein [Clostridium beijerinckii]NRT91860.1 signal transduction histidine kinase [Clostridium beijerinckii]NYC71387.1 signal transduction histidine kinase [Clostridium beijerinckii]
MELQYIDALITIFQSILFTCIVNYCLEDDKIKDNKKLILCIMLLSVDGFSITYLFGNSSVCIFATHGLSILIVYFIFGKRMLKPIVAYSLIYSIVVIWIAVFSNISYLILNNFLIHDIDILNITLVYISQIFLFVLCFLFRSKIRQIYKLLLDESNSVQYIIIISFFPDFLISLYNISDNIEPILSRNIILIALIAFIIFNIIDFRKTKKNSDEIHKLNRILTSKNIELKNIKDNYNLNILSLYELCDMNMYKDASNLLKRIINTYQNSGNVYEKDAEGSSLLSLATKHVIRDDIKVIVSDNANFRLTTMKEMDLYRIIINIVNNAVKAMKNKGTIIAESYEDLNNIVINIANDGEKIPDNIINKIFDSGFTTKNNNNKNHGYGLSIVRELIEKHNGRIKVESNEYMTKFTIVLPINVAA